MNQEIADKIYEFVKLIPAGKVATYGQIAKEVGTGARVVGNILHKNSDPKNIPCHRVVRSDGSIACGYAFGGKSVQKQRLEGEGVKFIRDKINISANM